MRSRRWLWVVALSATACLTLPAGAEGIVGGYIPSTSDWPWVARINTPTNLCTGTLISPDRLLTAAHCVKDDGALRPASDFTVAVNRRNASLPGEVRHVTTVVAHPGYAPGEGDDDVAVLFLDSPVALPAAPIGSATDWAAKGTVMGWGRTNYDDQPIARTNELKAVNLSLGSRSQCGDWDPSYRPATEICAFDPDGVDCVNHGDSGGPLMVDVSGWKLIGVVSHHRGAGWGPCGPHAHETFAWVGGPALRNWLISVANPACAAALAKLKQARKLPKSNGKRKKRLRRARALVAGACTTPG